MDCRGGQRVCWCAPLAHGLSSPDALAAIDVLARLRHHTSLCRMLWQQCELLRRLLADSVFFLAVSDLLRRLAIIIIVIVYLEGTGDAKRVCW